MDVLSVRNKVIMLLKIKALLPHNKFGNVNVSPDYCSALYLNNGCRKMDIKHFNNVFHSVFLQR